jgi:hypothetical protein
MNQPHPLPPPQAPADRRTRSNPRSPFGELLVESAWRPSDRPRVQDQGWRIAHGYAPERRRAAAPPAR